MWHIIMRIYSIFHNPFIVVCIGSYRLSSRSLWKRNMVLYDMQYDVFQLRRLTIGTELVSRCSSVGSLISQIWRICTTSNWLFRCLTIWSMSYYMSAPRRDPFYTEPLRPNPANRDCLVVILHSKKCSQLECWFQHYSSAPSPGKAGKASRGRK